MNDQNIKPTKQRNINIVALLLTIFSLLFGIYQYLQSEKLENLVRKRAWSQYKRIDAAHGELQFAIKKYKEIYKGNLNPELIGILNKADGLGYGVINSTIEQLNFYEEFTIEKINNWIKNKRVNPTHRVFFEPLCDR